MKKQISIENIYRISDDIVSREIEGELIIIPVTSGIGDTEDDIYSLNEMGKEVWALLDGKNSLGKIIEKLKSKYEASDNEIKNDVIGLLSELVKRGIIISIK